MKTLFLIKVIFFCLIILSGIRAEFTESLFPANHLDLKEPISYEALIKFADIVKASENIDVSVVGKSAENRSMYLFHLNRGTETGKWKVFFFGQQHGNEPAGKDALIYLINQIYIRPELLPKDVELWCLPMVNPDGAVNNKRRNGNGFDLNRDHLLLTQPETQVLHKVFRKIMPHVSVDCHEFMRDSKEYDDRGYLEWPLIMMDCANNPFFHYEIYRAGVRWCEDAAEPMLARGHNYTRYYLGGFPPNDELRHSTPEVDDARNGFGAYGGLSFIIESGVKRKSENPNADLGKRIDAYLDLLKQFLQNDKFRQQDIESIVKSRKEEIPEFIPTNYFWANKGNQIAEIKVIEKATGNVQIISTPNFMHDLIVKQSVVSPRGYAIPKEHAEVFKQLLSRHAITFNELNQTDKFEVEQCKLIRMEDFRDVIYNRYAGRQIVKIDTVLTKEFEAGSIYIDCDNVNGKRAALILEPLKLYGLFYNETYRNMISENNVIPVYRVNKN